MKEVFATRDPLEAHLVKSLLEREGIAAEVHGDTPYYPYMGHIPSDMMPSVWIIKDAQLERAAAFVAEYQRREHNSGI